MPAVAAAVARLGVTVADPVGSSGDGFTFVIPRRPGDPGRWRPLRDAQATTREATLWRMYVAHMLGGWEPPTRDLDVFFFGDEPELAARLVHLVVCGRKRATASWTRAVAAEGLALPVPGLVSIITDGYGLARAAITTVRCDRLRLRDVPEELAAMEGEGDQSLESWREGHLAYFQRQAASLGLRFDEDEEIAIEQFRVLKVIGRADE